MRTKGIQLFLIISLLSGGISAQMTSNQIFKKYLQKNNDGKNSEASLIIFTDSTFVNYSVFKDIKNQEVYVWYAYGKCEVSNSQLICTSVSKNVSAMDVTSFIKTKYRTRVDYRMINDYYEFVYEKYNQQVFSISGSEVTDTNKQLIYTESTTIN